LSSDSSEADYYIIILRIKAFFFKHAQINPASSIDFNEKSQSRIQETEDRRLKTVLAELG